MKKAAKTDLKNRSNPYSKEGILSEMPLAKRHQLMGEIASLMLCSEVHKKYLINDIGSVFLPAIHLNQFRIYKNKAGEPIAIVTWACLSDEVSKKYAAEEYFLKPRDWNGGDNIWLVDFIAPFGHANQVIKDLRSNIFLGKKGKALRVYADGLEKKIMSLKGKN